MVKRYRITCKSGDKDMIVINSVTPNIYHKLPHLVAIDTIVLQEKDDLVDYTSE